MISAVRDVSILLFTNYIYHRDMDLKGNNDEKHLIASHSDTILFDNTHTVKRSKQFSDDLIYLQQVQ